MALALVLGLGYSGANANAVQIGETVLTTDTSNITTASTDATKAISDAPTASVTSTLAKEPGRPTKHQHKVRPDARKAIGKSRYHSHGYARASVYGGGHEAQGMANGGRSTMKIRVTVNGKKRKVLVPAVACKEYPFGTIIEFRYRGRKAWGVVEDRGPYVRGRKFDLTPRLQRDLGIYDGAPKVHYRVIGKIKKGHSWKKWPGLITKRTKLYHKPAAAG